MMDEIDHHYLLSLGFNNAGILDPEKTLRLLRSTAEKAQVQLLKAKLIAGPEHLRFAARNASSARPTTVWSRSGQTESFPRYNVPTESQRERWKQPGSRVRTTRTY